MNCSKKRTKLYKMKEYTKPYPLFCQYNRFFTFHKTTIRQKIINFA